MMADNNIVVVTFPAHTTSALQPFDSIVAHRLKRYWNRDLYKFLRRVGVRKIAKSEWFALFRRAWRMALTKENIITSFRITGIWPLNRNAIDENKLAINKYMKECKK